MDCLEIATQITKDNRLQLVSQEFMNALFKGGVRKADELYSQVVIYAAAMGIKTSFKEQFLIKRNSKVIEEFKPNVESVVPQSCFPLHEFPEDLQFFLPGGYEMDEMEGIKRFNFNTCMYDPVFPQPIIVTARYKNISTGEHSVRLLFSDFGNGVQEVTVPLYDISNSQAVQKLTRHWIRATTQNAGALIEYLDAFMSTNITRLKMFPSISVLGWSSDTDFLPFSNEGIQLEGDRTAREVLDSVHCKGNFEQWKAITKKAVENDFVRVNFAGSFGSVLLKHTQKPSFIVHVWGDSGTGKTVALYGALSAWGAPKKLSSQWNGTIFATEQKAVILNHMPLGMNEAELLVSPAKNMWSNYSQFIYFFCEEKTKPRGDTPGAIKGEWKSICLSNGEGSLITDKTKDGEANRVLEFCTNEPLFGTRDAAIAVIDFYYKNYGCAGSDFVSKVYKYDLLGYWKKFLEETKAHGTGKQAGEMASLLLGDMFMHVVTFEMSEDEAFKNTVEFFKRIKRFMKKESDVDISNKAKDFVDNWIAQNYGMFEGGLQDRELPQIYGVADAGEGTIYVFASVLNEVLAKQGYNVEKTRRDFKDRGYFARTSTDTVTVQKKVRGAVSRCYAFKIDTSEPLTQQEQQFVEQAF